MATERSTREESWYGTGEGVNQLRGRLFKWGCLGAMLFGIAMVFVLLAYVALDAIRPLTADPGWHLTFFLALVAPTTALVGYYGLRDRRSGWVGATATALPAFCLLIGSGIALLLVEVFRPIEWFGSTLALLLAVGAIYAHRRFRSDPVAFEPTLVAVAALVFALVGVPGAVPSLSRILQNAPLALNHATMMLYSFAAPVAILAGWVVARRRESRRDGAVAVALTLVVAVFAVFSAPAVGIDDYLLIVLSLSVAVPSALYVGGVVRERQHLAGLALPVVVYAGMFVGAAAVEAFGFAGPEAWLDWQFLTNSHSRFAEEAGIYPALVGSIMMMLVIVVSAFPVGVAAAVYLEEYAPDTGRLGWVVSLIETNIANLAGVPSVVYGLLGLALFIRYAGMNTGSVIVGGFTVGLLILPIVIISAQEAIRAVPSSMRQASYGMGATKWQTVRNVVLPEALPGILTGNILAFGRAIGETAPLLMIGAAAVVFSPPGGFTEKFSAMPRQIFAWSHEPSAEFRYGVLAAGVVTLLVVLLSMNAAAILIRNKYQRRS
ncbi:phosphate ABC transporter permease PstA [Halorussus salilacus]|uniref:phosphate ABC transporter permease PstA n=1 Tax=Halorussus salilacus TaxID=2953750 RepID=UPI00209F1D36|nr:phosphate ABC transporter permease PstA [Halorussus salilacus]USZ67664.1 phosphate ABC transporter permease PstA [Halorussus salilacus]